MHRRPPARSAACRPRRRAIGWIALLLGLVFLAGTIAYLPSAPNGWILTTAGLSIAGLGLTALADPQARATGVVAIVCGLLGTVLLAAHAYAVQQVASGPAPGVAGVAAARPAVAPVATQTAPVTPHTVQTIAIAPAELAVRTAMLESLQQVRTRLTGYRGAMGDWPALAMNSDGMITIAGGADAGAVLGYAPANMEFVYSASADGMQFSARLTSMKYPMESAVISSASAVAQSGAS